MEWDGRLVGWAIPSSNGDKPTLAVFDGKDFVASVRIDRTRPDVEQLHPGHLLCGFEFEIPNWLRDGKSHLIDIRDTRSNISILHEPLRLRVPAAVWRPHSGVDGPIRTLRAKPIHILGDSTTLVFHDLLYQDFFPKPPTAYVLRTHFVSELRTSNFTTEAGNLDSRVLHSLLASTILLGDGTDLTSIRRRAVAAEFTRIAKGMQLTSKAGMDEGVLEPILVVSVGSLDAREIATQLGPDVDFHYESTRWTKALNSGSSIVPVELVIDLIERALAPFLRGLVVLKHSGLRNLFVHDIQPPSIETGPNADLHLGRSAVDLRYKVTSLFNQILVRRCREISVDTIEIWDDVVGRDGYLDPSFILDIGHLNVFAADITMRKLFAALDPSPG